MVSSPPARTATIPKISAIALDGFITFNPRSVLAVAEVDQEVLLADLTGEGQCGSEDFGSAGRSGGDRSPVGAGRRG